ncbi:hypothetical protein ACXR2T_03535 [Leucobacter sp. HY1910]
MSRHTRLQGRSAARAAAGIVSLGLMLSAAGCANPVDQLVNNVTEGALKEMTGVEDISLPTDGNGKASLPKGWPDIPMPAQAPITSMKTAEGMQAMFQGSTSDYENLLKEFESAGFEQESEANFSDQMRNYTFKRDSLSVVLSLLAEDADSEAIIQYLVYEDTAAE